MTRTNRFAIHGLLLATVFFWGMAFVFIKQTLTVLSPVELTLLRFGLAGLAFLGYLLFFPGARVPIAREDWGRFLLLGFLGVPGYHLALNFGEQWITASTASLIIAINPILTAFLSSFLSRESPGLRAATGIGVAVGGFLLVLTAQGGPLGASSGLGVALVFAAAVEWSLYSVLGKPLFTRYPSTTVTAYATLLGAAMLLPLLRPSLFVKAAGLPAPIWGAVLFLSLVAAFFGYLAWYYALSQREAAKVAVYMYLNPLFSVLGSRLILSEPVTPTLLLGGALIVGGVALANSRSGRAIRPDLTKTGEMRAGNRHLS